MGAHLDPQVWLVTPAGWPISATEVCFVLLNGNICYISDGLADASIYYYVVLLE